MKPSLSKFEREHKHATKKNFSKLIGIVVFFSFCWNIPMSFTFETLTTGEGKEAEVTVQEASLGKDELFKQVYLTFGHAIVHFFIPIVILMVLNTRLVLKVKSPFIFKTWNFWDTLKNLSNFFFNFFLPQYMYVPRLIFKFSHLSVHTT